MSRTLESLRWPALAVLAYAAWNASDLIGAWRHSPFDHAGWIAFLVWLLPALPAMVRFRPVDAVRPAVALVLSFCGSMAQLNVMEHAALAVAVGMPARKGLATWVWLAGAVSWMPALGYACGEMGLGVGAAGVLRVVLAAIAAIVAWRDHERGTSDRIDAG